MKNWKLFPKSPHVAKYVECYWFLEKEQGDNSNNQPKLNPDPSVQLIVTNAEQPYRYEHSADCQKGTGSHWIFPHQKTFVMDHSNPFKIIGIKFKVGALYTLKSSFPQVTLDVVLPFDINKLTISLASSVDDFLIRAADYPQETCAMFDNFLSPWLSNSQEDKKSELVQHVLPLINKVPISQIGISLHRSQRTIERSFLNVTKLTLKQYHSMIRLEALLDYLYKADVDINWAKLAAEFNFSDQPHLIRHLKKTIGKTPNEYTKQRDLTIDVYGNFEF